MILQIKWSVTSSSHKDSSFLQHCILPEVLPGNINLRETLLWLTPGGGQPYGRRRLIHPLHICYSKLPPPPASLRAKWGLPLFKSPISKLMWKCNWWCLICTHSHNWCSHQPTSMHVQTSCFMHKNKQESCGSLIYFYCSNRLATHLCLWNYFHVQLIPDVPGFAPSQGWVTFETWVPHNLEISTNEDVGVPVSTVGGRYKGCNWPGALQGSWASAMLLKPQGLTSELAQGFMGPRGNSSHKSCLLLSFTFLVVLSKIQGFILVGWLVEELSLNNYHTCFPLGSITI